VRALLDVNVIIALLDSDHVSHDVAWDGFAKHARAGWASCPITQNGCIRIVSNPGYPISVPIPAVIERLTHACACPGCIRAVRTRSGANLVSSTSLYDIEIDWGIV
jgi:hypothetical protein